MIQPHEKNLLDEWPANGPKLLWSIKGCGEGQSTVSIAHDMIYTAGTINKQTIIMAYDLNGKLKWKTLNGKQSEIIPLVSRYAERFYGVKSTPTIDGEMLYHLNEIGRLTALNAKNGKEIWSINIAKKFNGRPTLFGYSESVLIDGNNLICMPGGTKGYIVALDKRDGKTVWTNTVVMDTVPAYTSAVLVEDKGVRQILTMIPDLLRF